MRFLCQKPIRELVKKKIVINFAFLDLSDQQISSDYR
jgi:hypothetical protein